MANPSSSRLSMTIKYSIPVYAPIDLASVGISELAAYQSLGGLASVEATHQLLNGTPKGPESLSSPTVWPTSSQNPHLTAARVVSVPSFLLPRASANTMGVMDGISDVTSLANLHADSSCMYGVLRDPGEINNLSLAELLIQDV
ncbi:hypothetical protein ACH5RR_018522 [Cinchona calisaya]|uniref:Uncharacterized protein n=1 Tax=Cinchona calisaya TaxID=153742 RepID=A0ABD2ZMZ0_9GENT